MLNENSNDLIINSKNLFLVLNKKKGLTIKEFIDKKINEKNIFGTIPQGFYNHIDYDVDFFSGHFFWRVFREFFPEFPEIGRGGGLG